MGCCSCGVATSWSGSSGSPPSPRSMPRSRCWRRARSGGAATATSRRKRSRWGRPAAGKRDPGAWTAQGFETGTQREFAAFVAGTIGPRGPELFAWRLSPALRLPSLLVGSPQPPTAPGVLRLWNVGGGLLSEQALFNEPTPGGPPAGIDTVFLTWSDRHGQGPTPWAALRGLLAGRGDRFAADTSLARRRAEARHLAAQADAALPARDLQAFGRYYRQLRQLLEQGRRALAPAPAPR